MMLVPVLTCCATTRNSELYTFPDLGEATRYDDGLNIIVKNEKGQEVFIYNAERDSVTIPRWYWVKIINYGINTGGIKNGLTTDEK